MVYTFPGVWSKVITMVNQQKRKTYKKVMKWGYRVKCFMDKRVSYEKYVAVTLQQEYRQHTDYFQYLGNKSQQNLYFKFRLTPKVHVSFGLFRKKCIEISRSWRHNKQSKYDFEHNAPKYHKSEKASWSALFKFHLGPEKRSNVGTYNSCNYLP